jgi:hypothetical protein
MGRLSETYSKYAPLVNENSMASLGLIGSIGFLILIAWIFYRNSNDLKFKVENISNKFTALSVLNLSAVLLATIGGFGTIFAYLITSQIRCYNRISIFIAFFALFAVVLLLEEFSIKYVKSNTSRLLFNVFVCLVLVVGVLDQTSGSFAPPYASTKAEYLNDESFVNSIEAIMPENAMIFQLPYVPFPEYPPVNKMTDYSHFRAYLHSKDLRWSYGAMKGRPGDDWQRLVASMPVRDMLKMLSQTGFGGIYIDSYGFEDSGAKLISEITQILGTEPLVSDNQRLFFFDMTTYNRKFTNDLIYGRHPSVISVLHYKYNNSTSSYVSWDGGMSISTDGKVLYPIYLNESFFMEILVRPYKGQVAYAAILGNHPGKGYEGFVIQQNSVNQNEYAFGFGNGKEWLPNIKFNLTENKLNNLSINVKKNQTSVHIDGKFIGSVDTIESIENSDMPLYIGNWVGGDRPFNGSIEEIKIINGDQNN